MTRWIVAGGLFILILIGALVLAFVPAPRTAKAPGNSTTADTQPASLPDILVVATPLPNATVSSPLTVSGEARGTWYFEATAPTLLKDAQGQTIAQGPAQAQGDWMTTDFVPFTATLTFPAQPAGSMGTLILKNDNPSGDPANQKELDIPVHF